MKELAKAMVPYAPVFAIGIFMILMAVAARLEK